jgi:hypothetical protein
MTRQALHHLRAMAPLGSQVAAAKRQAQKARTGTALHGVSKVLPRPEGRAGAMPEIEWPGVYFPEEWPA